MEIHNFHFFAKYRLACNLFGPRLQISITNGNGLRVVLDAESISRFESICSGSSARCPNRWNAITHSRNRTIGLISFNTTNVAVAGTNNNDLATCRRFTSPVSKAALTIAQSCKGLLPSSHQFSLLTIQRLMENWQVG